MTLKESSISLTKLVIRIFLLSVILSTAAKAQLQDHAANNVYVGSFAPAYQQPENNTEYPEPKKVLLRSVMIPGWGQVTNKQIWKVPIVYALLGGLTYYSIDMHKKYHDYRAAYYNSVNGAESDLRFGSTPSYISLNASESSLQNNRDFYRNRRDFIYVTIGLAYILNFVDAYVYAHMRSFDVSDNLSMRAAVNPDMGVLASRHPVPGISFTLSLK